MNAPEERPSPRPWWRDLAALALALAAVGLVGFFVHRANQARAVPPLAAVATPTPPAAAATAGLQTAVFAGGCFWGVQGVFQHVQGVHAAVSGYAGGEQGTATYELVGRGGTGHAEAVQVSFDPRQVGYAQLLQVFFSVVHDPTQLDRQGPDIGPQYRSAIFPQGDEQARTARAYIAQLDAARIFSRPIVTKVEAGKPFFAAEAYHQDFMTRHPEHPYIVVHDRPKIVALQRLFPVLFRAEPALVFKRGAASAAGT
ncbi:MAG: peptide-methionine (S)-S-oxide reductase MsrA [Rubrivivax sp.]|nr:peptide-methionine (S)-S-oxide reductase MsrA [Rubrivivax sp.]